MKKAKLMLTAIAVVTVVGVVFAFKANKGGYLFCTSIVNTIPGNVRYTPDPTGQDLFCTEFANKVVTIEDAQKALENP